MDLTRKTRCVAGGHLTYPPSSMTYASMVSRDNVRLSFLITALNNLYNLAGHIQNKNLNTMTREKVILSAGNEWKSYQGKVVLIVIYLCGLNSSSLTWRNHLSLILGNHFGFQSSFSHTNFWLKKATDKEGNEYYIYSIVYVDDFIIVDKYP